LSASTSPKIRVTRATHDGESDDEEQNGPAGTSDTESEPAEGETKQEAPGAESPSRKRQFDNELREGMLPRDLLKRTAFYDPVAERQMSQMDAKLIYQLEQQKSSEGCSPDQFPQSASPILSPETSFGELPGAAHNWRNRSLASIPAAGGVEAHTAMPSYASLDGAHTAAGPGLSFTGHQALGGMQSIVNPNNSTAARQSAWLRSGPSAVEAEFGSSMLFDTESHITAELSDIAQKIDEILLIREEYMTLALQNDGDNPKDMPTWPIYPPPPEPAWVEREIDLGLSSAPQSLSDSAVFQQDVNGQPFGITDRPNKLDSIPKKQDKKRRPGQNTGEDFDVNNLRPLPGANHAIFKLDSSGVYQVFDGEASESIGKCIVKVPTIKDFYVALDKIINVSSDGPSKSHAFRRLQYLEGKFNLYTLINEYQETADSKKVPHRDFYNVRKVDTHVHHSACMNQKHLLRFIKSKMKKFPGEEVLFRDGKRLTLAEVFKSINLTAYDLSIDTLDMHVS
jgi:AMP deaminase